MVTKGCKINKELASTYEILFDFAMPQLSPILNSIYSDLMVIISQH